MVMGTIIYIQKLDETSETFSRWLPTKGKEWFTCQWNGDYAWPGTKLVLSELSDETLEIYKFV